MARLCPRPGTNGRSYSWFRGRGPGAFGGNSIAPSGEPGALRSAVGSGLNHHDSRVYVRALFPERPGRQVDPGRGDRPQLLPLPWPVGHDRHQPAAGLELLQRVFDEQLDCRREARVSGWQLSDPTRQQRERFRRGASARIAEPTAAGKSVSPRRSQDVSIRPPIPAVVLSICLVVGLGCDRAAEKRGTDGPWAEPTGRQHGSPRPLLTKPRRASTKAWLGPRRARMSGRSGSSTGPSGRCRSCWVTGAWRRR